jgi:hypothetical protein
MKFLRSNWDQLRGSDTDAYDRVVVEQLFRAQSVQAILHTWFQDSPIDWHDCMAEMPSFALKIVRNFPSIRKLHLTDNKLQVTPYEGRQLNTAGNITLGVENIVSPSLNIRGVYNVISTNAPNTDLHDAAFDFMVETVRRPGMGLTRYNYVDFSDGEEAIRERSIDRGLLLLEFERRPHYEEYPATFYTRRGDWCVEPDILFVSLIPGVGQAVAAPV